MLPTLTGVAVASQSWQNNGAIITIPHMDEMPAIADKIAEHLELVLDYADEWQRLLMLARFFWVVTRLRRLVITCGPNHVLPTARR